jgi:hypothetical protein
VSDELFVSLELVAEERGMRRSDLDFFLISHAIPYDSSRQVMPAGVALKLLPESSAVRRALLRRMDNPPDSESGGAA